MRWTPPIDLSAAEEKLSRKLRHVGRFYAFLRTIRAQLFDEAFQTRLIGMYADAHAGTEPVAPALVALLLLLQGYAKVSDNEAIRRAQMDDAWKMVLDTLGQNDSPVSKGTLQNMRNRLIETGMDQVLLARTVELARVTGLFGAKALKGLSVAIDSAPLEGAGRVEDTINLIGHALRNVVGAIGATQGRDDLADVAQEAGAPVVAGTSIKAALDLDMDWDADEASQQALDILLAQVVAVRTYLATQPDIVRYAGAVHTALDVLERVIAQDTEPRPPTPPQSPPPKATAAPPSAPLSPPPLLPCAEAPPPSAPLSSPSRTMTIAPSASPLPPLPSMALPNPPPLQTPLSSGRRIVQGVANDRLISLTDREMRHGRKSSTQRIDGYKRYVSSDLEQGLILAATVQPANVPEHRGADVMRAELATHGPLAAAYIDRAFLPSMLVGDLDASGGEVIAKPYSARAHDRYGKRDFEIDVKKGEVTCPAGKVASIKGESARFSQKDCTPCPQRSQCQKPGADHARVISIHPREALLQKLVRQRATPEGRAETRKRTSIEHTLAHVVFRQGPRARYMGARKNEYDLRRASAITNLQTIDRAERQAAAADRAEHQAAAA